MSFLQIRPYDETYGQVRYFHADRCLNNEDIRRFNKDKIKAEEIVTYDCGLMELYELEEEDEPPKSEQILAMIVRPGIERDEYLTSEGFEFCGYDLAETMTAISAITNCGAMFSDVINYDALSDYGLITTHQEAYTTQLLLQERFPDESHADCEIVEIWRKLVSKGMKIEIGIIENIDFEYDYSTYEPAKYNCVKLNEGYLNDWWNALSIIKSYFHNMKRPSLAVARYGVTIFPPESLGMLQEIMLRDKRINKDIELQQAAGTIQEAITNMKYIIIYGI